MQSTLERDGERAGRPTDPRTLANGPTVNQTKKNARRSGGERFQEIEDRAAKSPRARKPTVPVPGQSQLAPELARSLREACPGLPIIPLRRATAGDPENTTTWIPRDGWWDRSCSDAELLELLEGDRVGEVGLGVALGRPAEDGTRLIEFVARDLRVASPGLRGLFGEDFDRLARWKDEGGHHFLAIGDDRLEGYGPVFKFERRGESALFGVKLRLGPGDPAMALAVLPLTPQVDSCLSGRWEAEGREILPLPDGFYEELARHSSSLSRDLEAVIRADDRGKLATGTAIVPFPVAGPPSGLAVSGNLPVPAPTRFDLPRLAAEIGRAHRSAEAAASGWLEHCRQAGELLLQAKRRLPHGRFRAWVEENCEFSYRSAAVYLRIARRWGEVERVMAVKVQGSALSSLAEVLRLLAKPRVAVSPSLPESGPHDASGLAPARTNVAKSRPANGGDGLLGVGGPSGEPSQATPRAGDAPAGVPSMEESRRRAGDLLFLVRTGPLRARLFTLRNHRRFDEDATAWNQLRPVAAEFLARFAAGREPFGVQAELVTMLVRAKPPGDWQLCSACGGSGRGVPIEEECAECHGDGYLIVAS